jgi:hypothetical protein
MVRIDLVGYFAFQAQQDGPVRSMTTTGMTQRAEQIHLDPGNLINMVTRVQAGKKNPGRTHRPHRVGTRRSDTDFEQIEDADSHGVLRVRIE